MLSIPSIKYRAMAATMVPARRPPDRGAVRFETLTA